MATPGSLKFWFFLLPDDVIRQILGEYLYLSDLVRFDTALCHHQFRAEYFSLVPSLKLEFKNDTLKVASPQLHNEIFTKQIFYTAENPVPTSSTLQQFQFVHRRRITVPEIYIQARMSKADMTKWSSVLAKVKRVKLEPNENERFRSKSLLRFLRSLSFHLHNVQSFELIPYWSLYRYADDESSDASGAEELDSELSLDFADDTLSSVDGSVLEDDSHSISRLAPPISKTLLNIIILYFPELQHIKVQSIDGLESVHLTTPSMVSVWTNLRTLHLEHITFFLQTYMKLFETLASHTMLLETLLISMPRGDTSSVVITPDMFLSPLEPLVPATSESLRCLKHLSGDFLLIYPIYYYLCGNSQCLQSMDLLFRSKAIERFMLQRALQHPAHLFRTTDQLPVASFKSFTFDAVPHISLPQIQDVVMNWVKSTILSPFAANMQVFHIHGLQSQRTITSNNSFLTYMPPQLVSLQLDLYSWMAVSSTSGSSSSAPALKRLCLSPFLPSSQLPHHPSVAGSLLPSLLPWKDTLQELRLIQPQGSSATQFMRTSSLSSVDLFGFLDAWLPQNDGPPSCHFPALTTVQFASECTTTHDATHILLRFLPLVPALTNLDIAHWLPASRMFQSQAESTFVLTSEVLTLLVQRNVHLRLLALPPAIDTEIPLWTEALARLFAHLYPLRMVSILYFLDGQWMTADVSPSLVVSGVNRCLQEMADRGQTKRSKQIWSLETREMNLKIVSDQEEPGEKSFFVEVDKMKPTLILCRS